MRNRCVWNWGFYLSVCLLTREHDDELVDLGVPADKPTGCNWLMSGDVQLGKWGYPLIAGWFIRENPNPKWMITRGTPMDWKPPNFQRSSTTSPVLQVCGRNLPACGGFLSHRATPSSHPFLWGIFHEMNHPAISWATGLPLWRAGHLHLLNDMSQLGVNEGQRNSSLSPIFTEDVGRKLTGCVGCSRKTLGF